VIIVVVWWINWWFCQKSKQLLSWQPKPSFDFMSTCRSSRLGRSSTVQRLCYTVWCCSETV